MLLGVRYMIPDITWTADNLGLSPAEGVGGGNGQAQAGDWARHWIGDLAEVLQ